MAKRNGSTSDIKKFIGELELTEIKFLQAVGEVVKGQAVLLCPVGEFYGGNLRQDINFKVVEQDKFVAIGNNLEYAIYVNKGTGIYAEDGDGRSEPWFYYDPKSGNYYKTYGQKPQPYLQEAVEQMTPTIKELAKQMGVDFK